MLQRRTLAFLGLVLALGGQFLLDSQTQLGILLLGGCLLVTLLERWIYLVPLSQNWIGPVLLGLLGLGYWQEPRGWFFFGWAVLIAGTGLRADRIIRGYVAHLKAEEERQERLAAMGFTGEPAESEEFEAEPEASEAEPHRAAEPDSEPASEVTQDSPPDREATDPLRSLASSLPPLTAPRIAMAVLLGSLGAIVGGLVSYLLFLLVKFQIDLIALLTGWLVGRAILQGTGGRSHRALQALGALLSVLGVFLGRYLILRQLVVDFVDGAPLPESFIFTQIWQAVLQAPGKMLGIWFLIFVVVGAYNGWHRSRGYQGR